MTVLSANNVFGDQIRMLRTDPSHRKSALEPPESGKDGDFGAMLMRAMNGANQLQIDSDGLSRKMITDPDSVEPHDVTIAMAKANLAVSIAKAVVDRALRAYSEIMNVR